MIGIYGLQKMTLLDYPGRVACTVFLGGCDMRCPFCHNSELVDGTAKPVMTKEELMTFLTKRQGLLEGVAVTGGEPLLREENLDLLREIRALGYPVKLDTNGTHPGHLEQVLREGLAQYVAMDIKNSPERYAETVGLPHFNLSPVRESIKVLLAAPIPFEFRTTAVAELHDDGSFHGIGEWIRGAGKYYIQPFTDRETVPFQGFHTPEKERLLAWREIMRAYVGEAEIRGQA